MDAQAPRPERPQMAPGYGIAQSPEGLLAWDDVAAALAAARNYWLATTRPDGRPHVAPVWGLWLDGAFYFSTDPASRKARNLARQPAIAVHLESGDDVVILEGIAGVVTDGAERRRFADAYAPKYGIRLDPADTAFGVYRVEQRAAFAWRERDYPQSATRWRPAP
jgi:PPOX class probable F420-dependent enzyme